MSARPRAASEMITQRAIELRRRQKRRDGYELAVNAIAGQMAMMLHDSQEAIRKRLGRILKGGQEWPVDYVFAYAAVFGADPWWLLGLPGRRIEGGPDLQDPAAAKESRIGRKVH